MAEVLLHDRLPHKSPLVLLWAPAQDRGMEFASLLFMSLMMLYFTLELCTPPQRDPALCDELARGDRIREVLERAQPRAKAGATLPTVAKP